MSKETKLAKKQMKAEKKAVKLEKKQAVKYDKLVKKSICCCCREQTEADYQTCYFGTAHCLCYLLLGYVVPVCSAC